MTKADAQVILMRAFVATGELPEDIAALLRLLIDASPPSDSSLAP